MCPQRWAMEDSVITRPPPVFFILSNSRLVSRKWPKWFTPNSMPYPSSVRPSATNPGDILEKWFLKSLYFLDLLKLVFSRFFSVSVEQTNHHCCCSSLKTVFARLFDRYGNCDKLVCLSSGLHQFVFEANLAALHNIAVWRLCGYSVSFQSRLWLFCASGHFCLFVVIWWWVSDSRAALCHPSCSYFFGQNF